MSRWVKKLFVAAAFAAAALSQAYSLQDATIKIDHAVNSPTLSVKYAGMKASLIELKVNGKSKNTKVVSPDDNFGELSFNVDLDAMDEGDNLIEVVIYDTNGKVLGVQKTAIKVDRNGDGPVFLEGLKSGASLQGSIELKLGVNRDFRELYVSFFVDDEWKSLKNSQPYNFVWDTTRNSNGWHVVQAWVVDERNNTFKTKKVKVYVNNPGGRTDRIEDPANTTTTNPNAAVKPTTVAVIPSKPVVKAAVKPVLTAPTLSYMPVDSTASGATGFRLQPISGGSASGQKNLTPTGKRSVVSKPVVTNPVKTTLPNPVVKTVTKPAPKPVVKVNSVVAAKPASQPISISYGVRLPEMATFNLTWGAKKVNFDAVQPRVENGVPLTPFRFLLEQSGGKVGWTAKTKEVSAKSGAQDIYFQIGNSSAKVNKLPIKMEVAPFIDRSRAVVPLSFIKDALKVEVEYDPATGHVLITAPKK